MSTPLLLLTVLGFASVLGCCVSRVYYVF